MEMKPVDDLIKQAQESNCADSRVAVAR